MSLGPLEKLKNTYEFGIRMPSASFIHIIVYFKSLSLYRNLVSKLFHNIIKIHIPSSQSRVRFCMNVLPVPLSLPFSICGGGPQVIGTHSPL